MKRVLLKWCVFGFAATAGLCLTYWCVSWFTGAASFELHFDRSLQLSAGDGLVGIYNDIGNVEVIEAADQGILMEPKVAADAGFAIPGFNWRRVSFSSGLVVWTLGISLLIPAVILLLLARVSYRRYRRLVSYGAQNIAMPA